MNKETSYLDNKSDLASWVFSPLLFGSKKQVISVTSEYQRIDIWDLLSKDSTPSYDDAIKAGLTEGDPRWLTSEVASPDRVLFLDGHIQVSCVWCGGLVWCNINGHGHDHGDCWILCTVCCV